MTQLGPWVFALLYSPGWKADTFHVGWLRKIFFLDTMVWMGLHFFLPDGRLWTKYQKITTRTHGHKSHQVAQWHTHTLTVFPNLFTNHIKKLGTHVGRAMCKWLAHPCRKGFKYHWKWGQCYCITSGSTELIKWLWWPFVGHGYSVL